MARAATVAARSRPRTSASVRGTRENATIRPWSTRPATIGTTARCGSSTASPARARTRPSGVVTRTGEVGEAAALQHDADQSAVYLLAAGQYCGLPVEQLAEYLVEDVVEADPAGELDDREAPPVGLGEHLRGYRVQVPVQLDGQRRQPPLVQLGDQVDQRVGVVPQRVPGGEQQLVRLHPGQDVGYLHDVQPPDHPVEPARPGQHPRTGERRRAEHLADPQPERGLG